MKIPRTLKHQGHGFKLVLVRKIPKREAAAIYIGPLVLNRGKLQQEYLVMGISRGDMKELERCAHLTDALHALCQHQSKLYLLRSASQRPLRSVS